MHQAPLDDDTATQHEDTSRAPERRQQHRPGLLSQSDPEPERATRRPATWLVIAILLLATALVVLHITGVAGPGMH